MKNSIPHIENFKDIRIQQRSEVMAFGQVRWEKFFGELSYFLASCDRQEGNIDQANVAYYIILLIVMK